MGVVELGTNTEVGALRTVIVHRPGAELLRLNPRNVDQLLFDGLPWVARAQDEHDQFAELLRSRGVEVEVLDDPRCAEMMADFQHEHAELWAEDIAE